MSWEAQKWVWDIEGMASGPKWVLMGIANYVDQEYKSWPGLETLSARLGMTVRSVINHIDALVSDGFLVRERTKKHYGNNLYRLNIETQEPRETALKKYPQRGKTAKKAKKKTRETISTVLETHETVSTDIPEHMKPFQLKQVKQFHSNLSDKPISKSKPRESVVADATTSAQQRLYTPEAADAKINRDLLNMKRSANAKIKSDHHVFIHWWCERYQQTQGLKYLFNGKVDGPAVKALLSTFSIEEVERVADVLLESDDAFYEKAGKTIGMLRSQWNKLASRAKEEEDPPEWRNIKRRDRSASQTTSSK